MKRTDLSWWRKKIDEVDKHVLELLAKRERISKEIAKVKMSSGTNIFDGQREGIVISSRQNVADTLGLDKEFIRSLMLLVMRYSKEAQKKIIRQ